MRNTGRIQISADVREALRRFDTTSQLFAWTAYVEALARKFGSEPRWHRVRSPSAWGA
jgi:hypothetical protein